MEKIIKGKVLERKSDSEIFSFIIKSLDGNTYKISNCKHVPSNPSSSLRKAECFSGNVNIEEDSLISHILATLWVSDDNQCVLVYKD